MSLLNEASFLVTPNGYKEDKLYAAIPTNGNGDMTFTRGTTATRVNEAGLIELVPYNLLSRSEEFDNASWHKFNTAVVPVTLTNPTGELGYYELSMYDITTSNQFIRLVSNTNLDGVYTYTIFARYNTAQFVKISKINFTGNYFVAAYDLINGAVTDTYSVGANTELDATITKLPNGWMKLTLTANLGSIGDVQNVEFNIIPSGEPSWEVYGRVTQTTTTADKVDIWGAQLVKGSSALTYQKTVDRLDIPRIDYTDEGCPSILLEPQRTNLVLRSQEFRNASFQNNLSSVSANTTTAPDGTLTADTWTGDGTSGIHSLAQTVSATSGVAYTQSVFAKKGTNNFLQIIGTTTNTIYDANSWANFDLNTGVVGLSGISATATITDFGNGWYRCTMTATAITTASGSGFLLCLITSATSARAETNSLAKSVHLWGAQVEAGAYPTSYIPTTIGTVSRVADGINRDDIYTNNLITAAGGTWFIELDNNISLTRSGGANVSQSLGISDNSSSGIVLRNSGTTRQEIFKYVSASPIHLYTTTTDISKIAIKWNGITADVFENGIKVVSATSFTTTLMQFFQGAIIDTPKYIKQMALFPTPLSDDQCIALTTL